MDHWHAFYLRILTPQGEGPKWWVDILLLDTVVRDVVSAKRDALVLWRVHRRFKQDRAGHEFRLDCYTTDQTAQEIDDLLRQHGSVQLLKNNSMLREYLPERCGGGIESISDSDWPVELQKSWPYFIQGTSEMLLDLIEQLRVQTTSGGIRTSTLADVESLYVDLNDRLTRIWQRSGSHAFFHHINALFAGVPVVAQPSVLAWF